MQNEVRRSSKNSKPITLLNRFYRVRDEAFVPAFVQDWNDHNTHLRLKVSQGCEPLIIVSTTRYL